MAKLPLMRANSASSRVRGSWAASMGVSTSLRGFSATSFSVTFSGSTPAFTLMSLFCSRKTSARARLLGSLGRVMRSPSFRSARLLRFLEYSPRGAMGALVTSTRLRPLSAENFRR